MRKRFLERIQHSDSADLFLVLPHLYIIVAILETVITTHIKEVIKTLKYKLRDPDWPEEKPVIGLISIPSSPATMQFCSKRRTI
ncbi:hypothetical protein PMIN04_001932 [Paraphaeosphaeria minitans]